MTLTLAILNRLRRICAAAVVLFALGLPGTGQAQDRIVALIMFEQGEARLAYVTQILRDAVSFLMDEPDAGMFRGHSALRYIAGNKRNFRSILALDEDGNMLFDSFNRIRPWRKNFSYREYYQNGINAPQGEPVLHSVIQGRQSGLPFVPISMVGHRDDQTQKRLAVVTFIGSALLPDIEICDDCGIAVVKDGRAIISRTGRSVSPVVEFPTELFSLDSDKLTTNLRGASAQIYWKRSEIANLAYVYYRFTVN